MADHDAPTPAPPGANPARPAPGEGLRLARIGPVLALALTGSVLLSIGLFAGALWALGFPAPAPVGQSGIPLARLLDLLKLSFAVVAGIGGVVALVVAYRRQKVAEAAEHRQQAAELRADEAHQRADEAHQREATKLFNERFSTAANHLGHDSPAVRLAGVHALAGLADDAPTRDLRQTMIDVLCAYLRMPYAPDPGDDGDPAERLTFAGLREVRHTIIRVIAAHLRRGAATSWQGHNFDFTGVVFDSGDFSHAVFSSGVANFSGARFSDGTVAFNRAVFSGGSAAFEGAVFSGSTVTFEDAEFSGGTVTFNDAKFSSGNIAFDGANFSGSAVVFDGAEFSGGTMSFDSADFSGSTVTFGRATFFGGTVIFDYARLSNGRITFIGANFSGSTVTFDGVRFFGGTATFNYARLSNGSITFDGAEFSSSTMSFEQTAFVGGVVDFRKVSDWSYPPLLPDPVPACVLSPDQFANTTPEVSTEATE